jgi:hypothetical protein
MSDGLHLLFCGPALNPSQMQNPAQFGNLITSAVETPTGNRETTMQNMRRFFCAWTDVLNAATRDGCTGYPVSAFTKTAGLITNLRRLAGSRTSGSDQLCLVFAMLHLPAVGASGLHRIPRSVRYVYLFMLHRRGQLT